MEHFFENISNEKKLAELQNRAINLDKKGRSIFGPIFEFSYRFSFLRPLILYFLEKFESGVEFSVTLRKILLKQYDVEAGRYCRGASLMPGILPPGTKVGPFACIAANVHYFRRNHPFHRISSHPLFFNRARPLLDIDTIESVRDNPLEICAEAYIGMNAIILPRCHRIGIGAVVGAGAVVTKDVDDFSIVAGNPAKEIKKRFNDEICELLLKSRWWEYELYQLIPMLPDFLINGDKDNALRLYNYFLSLSDK